MAYILSTDYDHENADWQQIKAQMAAYQSYLAGLKTQIPPAAYAFATAPWHHDAAYPQYPHDGEIEWLRIRATGTRTWNTDVWQRMAAECQAIYARQPDEDSPDHTAWERDYETAAVVWTAANANESYDLWLRVRTVNNNGFLNVRYQRVQHYHLPCCVGYWLYDEIRRSATGQVIHEIDMGFANRWLIAAEDIAATWQLRKPLTIRLVAYAGHLYLPLCYYAAEVEEIAPDPDPLARALAWATLAGNTAYYHAARHQRTGIPHAAGVDTWHTLVQQGALYTLRWVKNTIVIEMSNPQRRDRFVVDPQRTRHLPAESSMATIAAVILQDLAIRAAL